MLQFHHIWIRNSIENNEEQLKATEDFIVSKAVNNVGVNINTASPSILKYISGLTKSAIDKIKA